MRLPASGRDRPQVCCWQDPGKQVSTACLWSPWAFYPYLGPNARGAVMGAGVWVWSACASKSFWGSAGGAVALQVPMAPLLTPYFTWN